MTMIRSRVEQFEKLPSRPRNVRRNISELPRGTRAWAPGTRLLRRNSTVAKQPEVAAKEAVKQRMRIRWRLKLIPLASIRD